MAALTYPRILNGDHAEFERDHADTPPEERPDWPLPSFDAVDWAKAFCRRFKVSRRIGEDTAPCDDDEALMTTWFANALMRGFDEHAARSTDRLALAWEDVRHFHDVFDHPAPDEPMDIPPAEVCRRADWIEEEARELRDAQTMCERADAFIDVIYFAIGGLVNMGLQPGPLWKIVQAANMAKVHPDGSVHRRESDGKVIKPDGWEDPGPKLEAEIQRQIAEAA